MRRAGLLVLIAALGAAACGGHRRRSPLRAHVTAPHVAVRSAGCSVSSATGAATLSSGCVYTLADGRRFACPHSEQRLTTAGALAHARECRPLARLVVSAAMQARFAAIGRAATCLRASHLRVVGGPVYDGDTLGSGVPGPIGELDVGGASDGALIGYYTDAATADRLARTTRATARRTGGELDRHGAISMFWFRPPRSSLRAVVLACLFA